MNEEARRKYEEELMEDAKRIMEEVNSNPALQNVTVPEEVHDRLFKAIREYEEEQERARLSNEEREWIRLGKVYQKKRKNRKYLVIAAVIVLAMAFGVTAAGGPEKLFETFKRETLGREQVRVNSQDGVELIGDVDEEEAYEAIEDRYGFYPVKLNDLPEGIEFQENIIYDEIQRCQLIYGTKDKVDLVYYIRPNYRTGSMGHDVEDEKLEEYEFALEEAMAVVKQYEVDGIEHYRWSAEFEYQDVNYYLLAMDMEQTDFEKILENLYFF